MSVLLLGFFEAFLALRASIAGAQHGPGVLTAVAAAALVVLFGAAVARLFGKAGRRSLVCLVPVYGDVVLLELAGLSRWWAVVLWVPLLYIAPIGLHDPEHLAVVPALALLPQLSWQLMWTGGVVGIVCLGVQAVVLARLARRFGMGRAGALGAVVAGAVVVPWMAFGRPADKAG